MHDGEIVADELMVRRLLRAQFPQWAELPLRLVKTAGTDHVIYRLGDGECVRLPRIDWAVAQAQKEAAWLPRLAPQLPLEIPVPLAMGAPSDEYPWPWSIGPWIAGTDAHAAVPVDLVETAERLAQFIVSLRAIDAAGAPDSAQLGLRGASLSTRDDATRRALAQLHGMVDTKRATALWNESLAAPQWRGSAAWHHGDLLPGNLILRDGRLVGVIDFGFLGAGDPACDLMCAWALFWGDSRDVLRRTVRVDDATWTRARGHALAQAAMYIPYYRSTNPVGAAHALRQLAAVIHE
jgi:aminoglycoside phosphotransferase (APT) family kinase protein